MKPRVIFVDDSFTEILKDGTIWRTVNGERRQVTGGEAIELRANTRLALGEFASRELGIEPE